MEEMAGRADCQLSGGYVRKSTSPEITREVNTEFLKTTIASKTFDLNKEHCDAEIHLTFNLALSH